MKSFGWGAEGGPPARASFLQKEEFSTVLGADKAGWYDFGVIEYEKVTWGEEGGEVANREISDLVCGTAKEKKAGRVARMSGAGSNPIVRDID